ncbi:hypothetical protein NECID01_0570 [Nematocida sp. AWRm77]|nr:hypothetical protein NECID01_0570 [Nematocida sp. AWRm77]
MENVAYLLSLTPWFCKLGMGDVLCRKILNHIRKGGVELEALDYALFCFRCKRVAVPAVTSKVRLHGSVLEVQCLQCLRVCRAETRSGKRDAIQRVRGQFSIKEFLE